jgi:chorismate mutase
VIHRGFSSYDKKIYRNQPQWHLPIELKRRIPELQMICDPSHIGGKRDLILPLSQQAMDLQFDGLIIESHCNPDCAWSDKDQQVTPHTLNEILNKLVLRDMAQSTEDLTDLRRQIDDIDKDILELLAKRMRVSEEIGMYKKEHNISILQRTRYDEILEKRVGMGEGLGMSREFMRVILEAIHEESIRKQMDIMNK